MKQALIHSKAFAMRFGLLMALLTLTRILFFAFNSEFFPGAGFMEFIYGLKFDASAVSMVLLPIFGLSFLPIPFKHTRVYQELLFALYLVVAIFCFILEGIDMEYFRFTLKRSTGDLWDMVFLGDDLQQLLPTFLADFWYIPLTGLLLISGYVYAYRKWIMPIELAAKPNWQQWHFYAGNLLMGGVAFGLIVLFFRGGTQLRPMSIMAASKHSSPQNVPLVLNTTFSFIKTFEDQAIYPYTPYDESRLNACYNPVHPSTPIKHEKAHNVMIILLESFSREHVSYFNPTLNTTPFLDSLLGESMVMTNCYANGKKSIEALPAAMAGLPSLMTNPYITSLYIGNKIQGLGNVLGKQGYTTAFFHGATNGSMDFNSFCEIAEIDQYHGREEFNDETQFDGKWGIYDGPFLQYTKDQLDGMPEPWFSTLFTLSSHHPYSIPADQEESIPAMKNPFLRTIRYTDNSLRDFFRSASQSEWFNNTIFILTADHTSFPFHPPKDKGFYFKNFRIPLAIYSPTHQFAGTNSRVCQQTDIMPTVLELTGSGTPYLAFGQSLLDTNAVDYAVAFHNELYILFSGDSVTFMDTDGQLYKQEASQHPDSLSEFTPTPCGDLPYLRAIVQQYNTRMINNQLSADE